MYDAGKVIAGIVIFLLLMTSPFWMALGGGKAAMPELEKPKDKKECVEKAAWMKGNHMQLLDDWRNEVVRENKREYVSLSYGTKYEKSLTRTCLDCHENKKNFCDRCHTYSHVSPYCFTCHVDPKNPEGVQ